MIVLRSDHSDYLLGGYSGSLRCGEGVDWEMYWSVEGDRGLESWIFDA